MAGQNRYRYYRYLLKMAKRYSATATPLPLSLPLPLLRNCKSATPLHKVLVKSYYHYLRGPFTRRLPLLRRAAQIPYRIQNEAAGRIMLIIGPPPHSCRADNDHYRPDTF